MTRYVYALVDGISGFADVIECVSIPPARYVAECNRVNRARPRPDAGDLHIMLVGEIDDETLIFTARKAEKVGDFSDSIQWLERKVKDAQANPKPY